MIKFQLARRGMLAGILILLLSACSNPALSAPPAVTPTSNQAALQATYADPFRYCEAVGTIDAPDARYTGDQMPDSLVQAMIRQGIVSADAPAQFQKNAVWRCMDGKVWACQFGANLPCQEKADTSQTPTQAMSDFCAANPDADNIPAVVTGRATVYEWACQQGKAVVLKQVFQPDERGFLSDFWYLMAEK